MTPPTDTTAGTDLVTRLMDLWSRPVPDDDGEAVDAFGALYTDPVDLNGTTVDLVDLVARARSMQRAYSDLDRRILDVIEASGRLVVAFRLLGVHSGPLATPLGSVAATGAPVDIRVIDILTLDDRRISGIVMVADELNHLLRLDVLALAPGTAEASR